MSDYYNHGSYPATGAAGASAGLRGELDSIAAGFEKLPALTGNQDKVVVINGSGTAQSVASTTGSGDIVRKTSPTLETPDIGTPTSGDATNLTNTIAPQAHAAAGKTTPVNADELPLIDSAAAFGLKRLTWANLKATLKTYFDPIYVVAGPLASSGITGAAPRATRIDVASAATLDLTTLAPDTDDIRLTGSGAVTLVNIAIGRVVRMVANGASSFANNASIVTQTGATIKLAAGDSLMLRATATDVVEVLGLARASGGAPVGQCYLSLSGGNLILSPFQGNRLTINGIAQTVPSSGVTLAPTGLTVGALHYVHAYMIGSTMALEASVLGHATDSTTGVEIKSGDATRTLVGMCVPQTGPVFADSGTKRLVLSWFNRRNKEVNNLSIAGGTTGSATAQEINSSDRLLFLSWADDAVNGYANVSTTSNNSGCTWAITFGLDGTGYGYTNFNGGTAIGGPVSLSTAYCPEVSEGSHYATVMGQISGGNTLTVQGGGTSTIRAIVRG